MNRKLQLLKRNIFKTDSRLIKEYFLSNDIRKLHVGSGDNVIESWLNADVSSKSKDILYLDATEKFRFHDNVFDYIFSEHMIEHIPYQDGCRLLSECYRTLKTGGKVRISTPDLKFLIDLYQNPKTELQLEYIKSATAKYNKAAPYYGDTFVINTFSAAGDMCSFMMKRPSCHPCRKLDSAISLDVN